MNNFFEKVINQFRGFFLELNPTRQISLILIFCVVVTVMVGAVVWASKTRFKVLFSNMNQEDSTMVARLLKEKNISYQISEDGKTISVPEDQVEIWRIEMAKQGLRFTGTVGYEVFDNQAFGTTSFVQKINKQRALEGELVKTIKYIKGIKRARVHLSLPENSPFVADKKPPGASVVLELSESVMLTQDEIRGIASLVASSVDGMRPDDVVIIDDRGKKLSDNLGDQLTADTANKMVLEQKMARQFEAKIEEILSRVTGEGRVVAKVSVKMDFTQSTSTETNFDNENKAVLSEVSNTQKLEGTRPSPQGIPGARSNLPGEVPQPGVPETKNNVNKETITRNFNVPVKVTKYRNPTASVKAVTAAVMIDAKQIPVVDKNGLPLVGEDGLIKKKSVAWTQAELENFREIVSSTVGIDLARGDKLVIRNMEFVKEDLQEAEEMLKRRENRELIRSVIKYAAVGVIMILFFLVVVRPFVQWVTENTVESIEDFLPKTIEELEKIQVNQKLPGLEDSLPQIEEKINPEKIEGNMLKEKIISLIEENPAKAAQIIHGMIHTSDTEKQIA